VSGPYGMATDGRGRYRLQAPPGTYRLEAWHPRLPSQSREVTIKASETVRVDFVLSVNDLEKVP
jgi:hypothetical protein